MIEVPQRILLARDHVDFRKQIDGLASICETQLGEEPLDGTLFLFVNRRRTAMKALIWTHGGFCLIYKKLEKGRIQWPASETDRMLVSRAELAALMEGIDLSKADRLKRWNPRNQRASRGEVG